MSYAYYRECRAVRGKERGELLAALKMEESLLDHWIILTSEIYGQAGISQADLASRAACEAEINRLGSLLEDITRPPKVNSCK